MVISSDETSIIWKTYSQSAYMSWIGTFFQVMLGNAGRMEAQTEARTSLGQFRMYVFLSD